MYEPYIDRITEVYPDLRIDDCVPSDIGQNNDVFFINRSLVFRFPKYEAGIDALSKEKTILERISSFVTLPIPLPQYEAFEKREAGHVFIGYPLIPGEPLWKESLNGIADGRVVNRLASQLAAFLTELHSVPAEIVQAVRQPDDRDPLDEMSELFNQIRHLLFPYMRKDAQASVTETFEAFLNGEAGSGIETTLIHGDFGASNIIWQPVTGAVSGIIDFGGSGLGDPAYDWAGIRASYGEHFFDMCMEHYPNGPKVKERVTFYQSTFALQEALHGLLHHDRQAFEAGIKDYR
ncbi:hypothetical protein PAESOLCIP111_02993 [Paenibacillus solanacearum]|uniref:Aminoglycoside phosphotransferase domain-containing protein n=1 Tax=Paenibacillus solanacearum TaxID=2048548 RepID=A0A916K1Q1_9BACL|nr:aminoglycoside phosphotransferase family protein [Paenibacillus solanacearum]CAG7628180.1 hypothetical protein PAESOLCIP111_02993 [Paenibacillus solanacearum]